jgi:DNA-binding transcriptional LysR family regulator
VLALVAAGQGAAIVPLLALDDAPSGAIAVAPIPGVGFRRLSVMHHAGEAGPEPVVGVMLEALRQVAKALEPLATLQASPDARRGPHTDAVA